MSQAPTDAEAVRSLTRIVAARRRAERWASGLYLVSVVISALMHVAKRAEDLWCMLVLVLMILMTPAAAYLLLWRWVADRRLAQAIEGVQEPSAAGALVDALRYGRARARSAAAGKLVDLLPRLTASDASTLSPSHYSALRATLDGSPGGLPVPDPRKVALKLAIMAHFAAVGYLDAAATVRFLVRFCSNPELREAAARCRDRLLEVKADAERSGTLLRPAEAPGETLLRAAAPAEEEHLLRAAEGETE